MRFTQAILFIVLITVGAWAVAAPNSPGQPVGQVMFITGKAYAQAAKKEKTELKTGSSIFVGQTLSTNTGGHLYVRMIDGAFLSLRPDAVVSVFRYTVDLANPSSNQIRLDVQKGVVRSVTGKGGEANKAGFRLNTPVAAIGISGTDFTVFTDRQKSSVSIRQGGVVVSPFTDGCDRNALGACDGSQVVRLFASNQQALAEVNAAHASLVNKADATVVPDNVQPAHPAEDQSVKSVKEKPISSDTSAAVTKVAETTATESTSGEKSSTTSGNTGSTPASNTTSNNSGTAPSEVNGTTTLVNNEKSASTTTSTATTAGTSTSSGNTTLVSSSTTLASNSGASNSNSATGLESTASGTLLNNKTTTTTSTADVASLSNVASEVGAKSSVTSELAGRVISQTPTATDLQPAKSIVTTTTTPVTVETPVQTPVVTTPVETNSKPQNFYWGRWTNYAENADQNIRNDPARSKQVFNANTVYLLASKESLSAPNLPKDRKIAFTMDKGEATVRTGDILHSAEIVGKPELTVDTGTSRFNTKLTVNSANIANGTTNLEANGSLTADTGKFNSSFLESNMTVKGAVNNDGTQAGYIFEQSSTGISGATSWVAQP